MIRFQISSSRWRAAAALAFLSASGPALFPVNASPSALTEPRLAQNNKPNPPPVDNSPITGTEGAPDVPLKKTRSVLNALLVVELPGQGVAGAAAKLSALALPIDPNASTEVKFNQEVGPMMSTALREVVKCLQVRHKGWPKGHRIELSFEDKFVPKDGQIGRAHV